MANLIKGTEFANDEWVRIADDAPVQDYALVSLTRWNNQQDELTAAAEAGKLGIFLESGETADLIGEAAQQFAVIGIDFPKFADGRGYSAARLLRERFGYQGDLRAQGDVLIDQLFFYARCGFTSYELRDDQDKEEALNAFGTFTVKYQNDANDQRPLFRHRT